MYIVRRLTLRNASVHYLNFVITHRTEVIILKAKNRHQSLSYLFLTVCICTIVSLYQSQGLSKGT